MESIKIHIERTVLGQNEDLGDFNMQKGDCYQPYWNTVCSSEVYVEGGLPSKMVAFQIKGIHEDSIELELYYPPVPEDPVISINLNEPKDFDFGKNFDVSNLTAN